jgi:hypothetical protein
MVRVDLRCQQSTEMAVSLQPEAGKWLMKFSAAAIDYHIIFRYDLLHSAKN